MAAADEIRKLKESTTAAKAEMDRLLGSAEGLERNAIKASKAYKDQVIILRENNEQLKELLDIQKQSVDALIQQEGRLKGLSGLQASLVSLDRERIGLQDKIDGSYSKTHEAVNSIASLNQELLSMSAEDVIGKKRIEESISNQLYDLIGMEGVTDEIIENLDSQFQKAKGVASMTEKQQTFLNKQLAVYEGIQDTIAGVLQTAQLLVSTAGGRLGAALIGAGYALDKIGETAREFGGTMGGAVYSTALLGTIFKDANAAAKGLASEMGGMADVSLMTQLNTNLMALNMGIGGEEAAKTLGIFSRLNGNSKDTAFNMADSVASMARASGLNTAQVMGDVAANSEKFAEYSSDGGKNLGLAAIQAAKLGVNMGTLTNVTDSLLDFETSITKELELGAMLGRNINLNRARALAYEGKVGASVKETIKQLGGVDAFNKMDIFQKRETAKLLGISVEELQKMTTNMDKLNDDGTFQQSTWSTIWESMKGIASGPLGSIVKGIGGAAIAMGQMGFDMAGMLKNTPILGRLFSKFPSKSGPSSTESPLPDTQVKTPDIKGKSMGAKLKDLAGGLKAMGNAQVLFGAFNLIPTALGFVAMLPALPSMAIFGLIAQGVSVGLKVLGPALKGFGKLVKGALPEIGIGLLVLALFGAALIPLGHALSLVAPLISAMGEVIINVFQGIALIIPPLAQAIVSVIGSVADGIVKVLDSITLEKVAAIGLLSLSFMSLAGSLMLLGSAGLFALPALLGIAAASTGLVLVAELLGIGGSSGETGGVEGGSLSEYETTMLDKMDNLIMAVSSNKDVYLDKDKVTNLIMQKSDRSIINKLNIFNG